MTNAANEDWPIGYVIAVPRSWRGDGLWYDIQTEAQKQIGRDLQEMYAELTRQPLPPSLTILVREIESRLAALSAHG
jgi:hypothetical protein